MKNNIFHKLTGPFLFAFFFLGGFGMFSKYFLHNDFLLKTSVIGGITFFGLFLLSFYLGSILEIKNLDLDYFKNIMVGVSGGLAVWIFSTIDFNIFQEDFWLGLNTIISRLLISVAIILIGFIIYKKGRENEKEK